MKSRSKSIFNIFTLLTLLTMLIGMWPASLVQAESFARPLPANGAFALAKSMGGAGTQMSFSIAVDSSGNIYTTGSFYSTTDFDPGAGIANLISAGERDIFISKLDSNGNFIWAKRLGGTSIDIGKGITVDSSGNVYTTGQFLDTVDFDPGAGIANLVSAGNADIFVSKLDSNGDFVWAKSMGKAGWEYGNSIAVDTSGNVHTTGTFEGTVDFNPSAGTANLTSAGFTDIFVSKLDSNGDFVWAKSMGDTNEDTGFSIAVDASGNVYTTGEFIGIVDFDPSAGTVNLTSAGLYDIFVSKLNSNGDFVWAKSMGGTSNEIGHGLAVDTSGNVYTTGYFAGTADFDPGVITVNLNNAGDRDIFISKLDSNGSFVWAKSMGGTGLDQSNGISIDTSGNVYTTGRFRNTVDFDPGIGTADLSSVGQSDIFVSKLDSGGNFVWAKNMGGASSDIGYGIALDSNSNIYTSGYYFDTADFDPGAGTANLTSAGAEDIFISKLNDAPTFADVPGNYWAYSYIERLYNAGVTGGCSAIPLNYCPDSTVTRAQMAVFLLKGKYGPGYVPPLVGVSTGFNDVATDYWAAAWIKQLAAEHITSGCGVDVYCPDATVTRAQMAIFLLKASKFGTEDTPPAAIGIFNDVPVNYWAAAWIEKLAAEGVTSGCGNGNYCPDSSVTRAQMAIFLVKTYGFP